MPIRRMAFSLFLSTIAILASTLAILFVLLGESRTDISRFINTYDQLSEICGMEQAVSREASSLGLYLLGSEDPVDLAAAEEKTRTALKRWRRLIREERALAESCDSDAAAQEERVHLARYEAFRDLYSAFDETVLKIITLAESGEKEAAVAAYREMMSVSGSYGKLADGFFENAVEKERACVTDRYDAITGKNVVLRTVGVGLVICAVIVMFLTYGLIGRRVLSSLRKLERGAREYRHGEFPYVFETNDEIGSLSRAIDYMTRQINRNSLRLEYVENRIGLILSVVDRISQGQYGALCTESDDRDIFDRLSRGINTMIRELLGAKTRIEEHRDWLDLTLSSIREGLISANAAGEVTNMNEAAERLTGWKSEEVLGTDLAEFFRITDFENARPSPLPSLKGRNSEETNVEGGGRFKLTTKTGQSTAVEANWTPISDSTNSHRGIIVVFRDISALLRKKSEVKRLQSKIMRQEKLSSIGLLAAGIAHEINNPIGYIESNLRSLEVYLRKIENALDNARLGEEETGIQPLIEGFRGMIADNKSGIDKIARIVAGMSAFSRVKGDSQPVPTDINALVRDTVSIADSKTRYYANVVLNLGEIPMVRCIPGKVNQVLLNIILNAAAAIKQEGEQGSSGTKGTIRISTSFDGRWIHCRIADSGPGMRTEDISRVFDPFFTTKEPGEGTGLGLHVSYRIMKEHGGEIIAENAPESGAVFTLRFPTTEGLDESAFPPLGEVMDRSAQFSPRLQQRRNSDPGEA